MNKAMALLLAAALLLAVPGLAEADAVAGSWYAQMGGVTAELKLNADGTYALDVPGGDSATGVWTFDDGYLYMDGAAVPTMATWGDDALMMSDGSAAFTREKPWTYEPAKPVPEFPAEYFAGYWKCVCVDVDGQALPAGVTGEATDLYIEGQAVALGGPRFGDIFWNFDFDGGALTADVSGQIVTLALQEDGLLRLTLAGDAPATLYLQPVVREETEDE